ncbi:hypothetical protein CSP5_1785 [Cuniculiplasma divulgatum]|uniref:Uncharacterized protein n=1 Tax=Cuniculiplasma divulgatum TaxID=1673428 RepID=A0A1N5WE74_9ARCH|nr:hypothetical protein CSP5_1785 [Cuniculiplasma divulgatum]
MKRMAKTITNAIPALTRLLKITNRMKNTISAPPIEASIGEIGTAMFYIGRKGIIIFHSNRS